MHSSETDRVILLYEVIELKRRKTKRKKDIYIFHRKYGRGKVVDFHPYLHVVVLFSDNGRVEQRRFACTKRNLEDMRLMDGTPDGVSFEEVVDEERKRVVWYKNFFPPPR